MKGIFNAVVDKFDDDLDECLMEIRAIVENGAAPVAPEQDAESFRAEIARILSDEYADYLKVTE